MNRHRLRGRIDVNFNGGVPCNATRGGGKCSKYSRHICRAANRAFDHYFLGCKEKEAPWEVETRRNAEDKNKVRSNYLVKYIR